MEIANGQSSCIGVNFKRSVSLCQSLYGSHVSICCKNLLLSCFPVLVFIPGLYRRAAAFSVLAEGTGGLNLLCSIY